MFPGMLEILAVLVLFTLEFPTLPVETFEVASQIVHSGSCPHGLDEGNEKQIVNELLKRMCNLQVSYGAYLYHIWRLYHMVNV